MINIYAVRDEKAGLFNQPFCQKNHTVAIRAFSMEVNRDDPGNVLFHNPEDFTLYELGSFDEDNGALLRTDKPQPVATATSLKKEAR